MTNSMPTVGFNRTGIATSRAAAERMIEGTSEFLPDRAESDEEIGGVRALFARESGSLGSLPPPASIVSLARTALQTLKGAHPTQFVDKLGERLAFERCGVRLYEALISKHGIFGGFEGGPSREDLERQMMEEYEHLQLLTKVLGDLGADPTVMTPSADLHATMTKGILEVMVDARTSLVQCLEALLVVELADNECWEALIDMARQNGAEEVAESFVEANDEEGEHLENVRAWIAAAQRRP